MREEFSSHPKIACAPPNLKRTKNSWPFSATSPPMKTMAMRTINALVTGFSATHGVTTMVRKGKSACASQRNRRKRTAEKGLATFRPKYHGHILKNERVFFLMMNFHYRSKSFKWLAKREKVRLRYPFFRIYYGQSKEQLWAHHNSSVVRDTIFTGFPPPFRQIKLNCIISPFYISFL